MFVRRPYPHNFDGMRHNSPMEKNGIVRKVDGLGRIVIPREFRKLHKIALGDPMEISCLDSGEIVLRKLDMTLALRELAMPVLPELARVAGVGILLCGRSEWLGGCGEGTERFSGALPEAAVRGMEERKGFCLDICGGIYFEPIAGDADVFGALCAYPANAPVVALRPAAAVLGGALQKF